MKNAQYRVRSDLIDKILQDHGTTNIRFTELEKILKIFMQKEIYLKDQNWRNNRDNDGNSGNATNRNQTNINKNNRNYRTQNCKFYNNGYCKNGNNCSYIHDNAARGNNNRGRNRSTSNNNRSKFNANNPKEIAAINQLLLNETIYNQFQSLAVNGDNTGDQEQKLDENVSSAPANTSINDNIKAIQVVSTNYISDINESKLEINQVKKVEDDQYELTNYGGTEMDIKEQVLTKKTSDMITKSALLWDKDYVLSTFIDSGAGATVLGTNIFNELKEYLHQMRSSLIVVVADKQKQYKLTEKLVVPIRYGDWSEKLCKNIHKKKYLELWHVPILDTDMIILGRDSMKVLKLKICDESDIKRVIYFHKRCMSRNIIPSDEDTNNYLRRIEYRHSKEPGLYVYNKTNTVEPLRIDPNYGAGL